MVVVNRSWELVPWADLLYACDGAWWLRYRAAADFSGLKVTQDAQVVQAKPEWNIRRVHCDRKLDALSQLRGSVGWGGNGGFQALNLALHLCRWQPLVIGLVGFDMTVAGGVHWHGNHPAGMNNPTARNAERWRRVLDGQAGLLQQLGVQVLNLSRGSALRNFDAGTLDDILSRVDAKGRPRRRRTRKPKE